MTAAVASALFAAAWKGTLLAAFALAVHRIARNRIPPRWLCGLFLVAIARLLLPVAPAAPFSVFNLVPEASAAPASTVLVDEGGTRSRSLSAAPPRTVIVPEPSAPSWTLVLLAVWATGSAFFLGRGLLRTIRFHRQLSDSRDVDLSPLIDECRNALHVRRRVRVATTDAVATPSLHGWLRPTLLLPAGFLHSFSREQLRYVVLHELAHLRRSDVLVNWLATAAHALHWFNPLVRLALARFAEERELACDALALEALHAEERPAYGGTVVDIVDRLSGAHAIPALVGMTATPKQLKRRIVMIARFRQSSRYSILFAALIVAVGLVTLTDARAGEVRVMKHHAPHDLSPAAQAVMESLEQRINLQLTAASVEDVIRNVGNAAGVSFTYAEGAITDETRQARITLNGTGVPAHLYLMETLTSVGLGLKFTDTGAQIIKADSHHRIPMHGVAGGAEGGEPGGEKEEVIVIRQRSADAAHADAEHELPPPMAMEEDGKRRVEVKATVEENDGVTKKKLTINSNDGKPAGTLEIEIVK